MNLIEGKLVTGYSHRKLICIDRLTYNNLVEDSSPKLKSKDNGEEKNYLAPATTLMTKLSSQNNTSVDQGVTHQKGKIAYQPWRYHNPDNKTTKVIRGSTMKWCLKDCHDKLMWYDRKNCMDHSDYHEAQKKRNSDKISGTKDKATEAKVEANSSEFKVALAAMTSPEDFAALQEKLSLLKDQVGSQKATVI